MRLMKHYYLLTILLLFLQQFTAAQISKNSMPASFNGMRSSHFSKVEVQNITPHQERNGSKGPIHAGYTLLFNYNIDKVGSWEQHDGNYVWRLEVVVPNAEAINLYFNSLNLLPNEKIFLYNPQKDLVLGAFTSSNNGLFMSTDFVLGSTIIIEFNSHLRYKKLPFLIHELGILFGDDSKGFGDAGTCEVHVNCIEGEDWQYEKDGVARILVKQNSDTFWCTGSLINNTNNDGKPYFLTANHCGEYADSIDYAQWLFYFNFESSNCEQPVFEPELNTLSGSYMISHAQSGTTEASDFKLLLLEDRVPPSYKPYYNGWDISGEAAPSGVTIHHPQGDLKMISTYKSSLVSAKYNNQTEDPDGKYWMVNWDITTSGHGVTEGGSSGSPIFNNEGYIVGALTGGYASCINLDAPDYYGKLSYSWASTKSDSTGQLKYWLDPDDTGVTSLKGNNLDSTNIFAGFSGEPTSIIMGQSVYFINTSFGNIGAYNWYFEGGNPESSELENPGSVKYSNSGEFDVRLIVSTAEDSDTLLVKNYIKVLPSISPNPSNGKIKLAFGKTIPDDILGNLRIFNAMGKEINYYVIEETDNCLILELSTKVHGLYLIDISSEEIKNTYKIIVNGTQSPISCR